MTETAIRRYRTPTQFNNLLVDYKQKYDSIGNDILPTIQEPTDNSNRWATGTGFWHYFLKMLVLIGCLAGCAWQCINILHIYLSFPVTVFVYVETMEKLLLPGITICNSNKIMMSKLRAYNQTFDRIWSTFEETGQESDDDNATKLDKQFLIDETIRVLLSKLTVNEFIRLGHTADDLIIPEYFKCATDPYNPDEPCRVFANIITTGQDVGNCFTLFHRSESHTLQEIAIQSGLSQSPVIRGHGEAVDIESADQPFHPNEILRLKINFSASEYTTLNEAVFGNIIIHDDSESPPVRERSLIIYPGYYYELFLSKQTDFLLPYPYITDCVNYYFRSKQANATGEGDTSNEYLHFPLSRENCLIGCMAHGTMERCSCWPPELPFMKGVDMSAPENKMKWCDWNVGPQIEGLQKPANSSWFKFCFSDHEHECNKKCKLDCKIDRFAVITQERVWPSKERIEHSKHAEKLQANRECCAMVSIRYWNAEATIHQYQPKYEIVEVISYWGGLLSMWLGFSLVNSYGLMEKGLMRVVRKYRKYKKSKRIFSILSDGPFKSKILAVMNKDKDGDGQRRRHRFGNHEIFRRARAKVSEFADKTINSPRLFGRRSTKDTLGVPEHQ